MQEEIKNKRVFAWANERRRIIWDYRTILLYVLLLHIYDFTRVFSQEDSRRKISAWTRVFGPAFFSNEAHDSTEQLCMRRGSWQICIQITFVHK